MFSILSQSIHLWLEYIRICNKIVDSCTEALQKLMPSEYEFIVLVKLKVMDSSQCLSDCGDKFLTSNVSIIFKKKKEKELWVRVSSVHSLSHVQLFVTPWAAVRQASLSITNSQSLLKLMSIESMMPSNHLILCRKDIPKVRTIQLVRWFGAKKLSCGAFHFSVTRTDSGKVNTWFWF